MSCDQALDKLSEKLSSRLLVQEEYRFQKGAQCAPLAAGAQKSLACIVLNAWVLDFDGAELQPSPFLSTIPNGWPLVLDAPR